MSAASDAVAQDTDTILSYVVKHWHFGDYRVQKMSTDNQIGINK